MQATIHNTARDAGCYTFVEEAFFYDDVIDPSIVRDVHVFDKAYVPLLVKKIYLSPAGTTVTHTYHVVGRIIENPGKGYEDSYLKLQGPVPRWVKHDKVQALRTLQGKWPGPGDEGPGSLPSREWIISMPPPEVRPGRWLVEQLQAVHKYFDLGVKLTTEEKSGELRQQGTVDTLRSKMDKILNAEAERDEKIAKDAMDEARYRMRNNWPQMKRAIDEGRLAPPPHEKKPFLDLNLTKKPDLSEPLKGNEA